MVGQGGAMLQYNVSSATNTKNKHPKNIGAQRGNAARTEREGMLGRVHIALVAQENKARKLSFATETALPNN